MMQFENNTRGASLPILRLPVRVEQRRFDDGIILHGRSSPLLVPIDVTKWNINFIAGHVTNPRIQLYIILLQ